MATWTPTDLTYPDFVRTQLTPLDRSNALLTMNNSITSIQSALTRNQAALADAQELTNGPLSFGTVRDARRAAQEAAAAGAANAAELQAKYEELQAQRSIQIANADKYLRNVQSGEEALRTAQVAVNNLEQAGAVPPGTNQFTPPEGYTGSINPPQQVPDSQNPSPTVTETDESIENPSPVTVQENDINPSQEVTENVFDTRQEVQESVFDPTGNNGAPQGITTSKSNTRSTATNQDAVSFEKAKDWRVRLSLAPSAKYLYKADNPGILKPLQATNGVIFPYTPTVSAVYTANYDASELIHSNYKIYNYKSSNVDTVTITGDFTAQDTTEANYLLAVIQFFKSVTKMFYGQDQNPRNGTPPPLVYMSGLGTFQFDNHPLAVTNFTYSLPNEVDYIRAGSMTNEPGSSTANQTPVNNTDNASTARIQSSGLGNKTPNFQRQQSTINSNATYVPTKMQIAITCIPIVTRNDISNNFSLKNYATGALLQGSKRNGGGMW
jgi:hypothetical protein